MTTEFKKAFEPLSLSTPTDEDKEKTKQIIQHLTKLNVFPPVEEQIKIEEALSNLYEIVKEWTIEIGMKLGLTKDLAEESGLKVETFGSYRLGVHGPASDIDTLWIFPKHITKKMFFEDFKDFLSKSKYIQEINAVPDAFVPLIATTFDGIEIDMLFARLSTSKIPDDFNLLSDNILKDVDEETQRSFRGPRDADMILKLVPDIETFRTTLRCIKVWASKRAISTQKFGYLGGVSWAILVAQICQLYPNAAPNVLVHRFFKIYKDWPWRGDISQGKPRNKIALTEIKQNSELKMKVWNQSRDDLFSMSIITPSYPSMNSSHNISPSITKIITQEFRRGYEILEKNKDQIQALVLLFEDSDFFMQYTSYLEIETSAETEQEKIKWESFIESKIKKLIEKFHQISEDFVIHPYPKNFEKEKLTSCVYIGLKLPKQSSQNQAEVNIVNPIEDFKKEISKWPSKTNGMKDPKASLLNQTQIPDFVIHQLSDFQKRKIEEKRKRMKEKRKIQEQLESESPQKKVKENE